MFLGVCVYGAKPLGKQWILTVSPHLETVTVDVGFRFVFLNNNNRHVVSKHNMSWFLSPLESTSEYNRLICGFIQFKVKGEQLVGI